MELSPNELRHRIAGLSRSQRRTQARQSWNLLSLWADPEYAHMSRQAARDASWKAYWAMWREDYVHPEVTPKVEPKGPVVPWYQRLKRELKAVWDYA